VDSARLLPRFVRKICRQGLAISQLRNNDGIVMSILKPRNRLVYFRVSEDEFQRLNQIRETTGARSLSDLARSAMQTIMQDGTSSAGRLSERMTVLETIMNDLNHKVQQLAASLGKDIAFNLKLDTLHRPRDEKEERV